MPHIRKLPPHVVNQIAAGEVIERPASVVKELLENSIDAGATRIDVSLEQGGIELVRVSDNGCGIAAEELLLAVTSHATSKLPDADDLFRVRTLGFRGEALASIAAVSHLLSAQLHGVPAGRGANSRSSGAQAGDVPCGMPRGTVTEVRNLFFNTPVRRKYLRTPQTELGHASEAFTRIALAHPQCISRCSIRTGVCTTCRRPKAGRTASPLSSATNCRDHLLWVESREENLRLPATWPIPR